jgi:hypothetical protein
MGVSWSATLSVADKSRGVRGGDTKTLRLVGRARKLIRAGTIRNPDGDEGSGRAGRRHAGDQPSRRALFNSSRKDKHWGRCKLKREPMTVFVYVNTNKQVGDKDHIKVFANADAAETWFEQNDPEGVAFEYEVLE